MSSDASYDVAYGGSRGRGRCGDAAVVLVQRIAEVADKPLVLEPDDRRVERETNTWWPKVVTFSVWHDAQAG